MNENTSEWEIEMMKSRYEYLEISTEQAQKMHVFETDKNFFSKEHYFSIWEEWDYELTVFKEILDEEQFAIYEKEKTRQLKETELAIEKGDSEPPILNNIAYQQEVLEFYEKGFVQDLLNNSYILFMANSEKTKISFLKEEYRGFLQERRHEIIIQHFRFSRQLEPNKLSLELLRHRANYIWPAYGLFKMKMDEPTRDVARYIAGKYRVYDELKDLLGKKYEEMGLFFERLFNKYYKNTGGWHVKGPELSPGEQKENDLMTLLLLDRDRYGLK